MSPRNTQQLQALECVQSQRCFLKMKEAGGEVGAWLHTCSSPAPLLDPSQAEPSQCRGQGWCCPAGLMVSSGFNPLLESSHTSPPDTAGALVQFGEHSARPKSYSKAKLCLLLI